MTTHRDGITVVVYRYSFRGGYYAEALASDGRRLAFTGVFRGRGGKERAVEAAFAQATTGQYAANDTGCPG